MYVEMLKELYCAERKKLEGMWIRKQEAKLRILKLRKQILDSALGDLSISQLLNRGDITSDIKDSLFRDKDNEKKITQRLDEIIDGEFDMVEAQEKDELKDNKYSPIDYADYLFALEKVSSLETEMGSYGLIADIVYEEFIQGENKKIGGGE